MEGYRAQPRYQVEGLDTALNDVTETVDFPCEASSSLWNGRGVGWVEGGGTGRKGGRRNCNWYVK